MTEYKTMRVPVGAWEDAKDAKREGETWGKYLRRCADVEGDATTNGDVSTSDVATAEDMKDMTVLLRELRDRVERMAEQESNASAVSLEATERRKIAEEVAEQMR